MSKKQNKKGIELTMQTIVIFIIAITVLIVVIFFFSSNYTQGSTNIANVSSGAIDAAKNYK